MAEDEVEEIGAPGMRSFWSGTITFGLVSVPVALCPASRPRGVALHMVSDGGERVQRRYVCSKDGKPLEADDIVRGYEIEKGRFVVVTDDELEAIEPRKSREIDLRTFVPVDQIDPMYFERGYFLTPASGSNKAYRLLAQVMESAGRAGIATFVMRAKEYLVAIIAEKGILRAETLRFGNEVRTPEDLELPKKTRPKAAEVKKFQQAISKHSGKVKLSEFLDEDTEKLQSLVKKKQKRGEDVIREKGPAEEDEGGEVVDLLEVLRRTLEKGGGARRKSARRVTSASRKRGPAKKRSAARRPAARKSAKRASSRKRGV